MLGGILFNPEMKLQAMEQNNNEATKPGFIPHPILKLKIIVPVYKH